MKIKINDDFFFFFDQIKIVRTLDSIASAFSFSAYFDPNNEQHKVVFKPLSYPKVEIYNNEDRLLLTGVIVSHSFVSKASPELVKVSGYSTSGTLEDVSIPYSSYPLESIRRSLKDITEKLIQVFGLKLVIDSSVKNVANLIYEKSVAEPGESIKSYVSKLTAQRNVVLSHDEKGNVLMFKPNIQQTPRYFFNNSNSTQITLGVNGQNLFDEVSVIRQPSISSTRLSPVDTVKNPMVLSKRTKVKVLSSGTVTDTKNAANNELASQLQSISIGVVVTKAIDLNPGDIVEVQSPEAYLYQRTKLIIKSIEIYEDKDKEESVLKLVLPESYTGDTPKNIFV